MNFGWMRRIFAVVMAAALFTGDALPAMAETVSGGDAVMDMNTEETDGMEAASEENAAPSDLTAEPAAPGNGSTVSDGDAEKIVEIEDQEVSMEDEVIAEQTI